MSTNPAEAYAEILRREREANPVEIDRFDDNVLASQYYPKKIAWAVLILVELPEGVEVISVVPSGASAFCKTFRIDTIL
jgi:hypothetical protein